MCFTFFWKFFIGGFLKFRLLEPRSFPCHIILKRVSSIGSSPPSAQIKREVSFYETISFLLSLTFVKWHVEKKKKKLSM